MKIRCSTAAMALAALILASAGCGRKGEDPARIREYAGALASNELYAQAVAEYAEYLDTARLSDAEKANVTYVMAGLYFERLHDYENALAAYLRIKHMTPEKSLMPDVDRRIVACLERLNRSGEAKQVLDEATALSGSRRPSDGTRSETSAVVAQIGDRTVTAADLKHEISRLPASVAGPFETKAGRMEFLRQYVIAELFYGAAQRKGLDRDADVQDAAFQAKRSVMVQKYLEQEVGPQVRLSAGDVQLFYKANLDRYAEKDANGKLKRQRPLEEVREQAQADAAAGKQQEAVQALINRMMTAEGVRIYEDRVE
jgi:tetratricopeptide (TPR) repeat protein